MCVRIATSEYVDSHRGLLQRTGMDGGSSDGSSDTWGSVRTQTAPDGPRSTGGHQDHVIARGFTPWSIGMFPKNLATKRLGSVRQGSVMKIGVQDSGSAHEDRRPRISRHLDAR